MKPKLFTMSNCLKSLGMLLGLLAVCCYQTIALAAPAKGNEVGAPSSFIAMLKDQQFKKLYSQALAKSPANHKNSWVYKDIGLFAPAQFAGQNGNRWIQLSTCANKDAQQCRTSHIDVFYDPENQQLFAYLTLGSRVGWSGDSRNPTSLEQSFFKPYLTGKDIR